MENDKIKAFLKLNNIDHEKAAKELGIRTSSFTNKINQKSFKTKELIQIAELGNAVITFSDKQTKEPIIVFTTKDIENKTKKEEEMKMDKQEIKERIEGILINAWDNKGNARYYLEKLPYAIDSDYDEMVHEIIDKLNYNIVHGEKEYYEYNIEELVDHYFANQENYDF